MRFFSTIASILITSTIFAVPGAIVFDFGGVMTGEQNREIVVQFLKETFQLSDTDFDKVNEEKRRAIKGGVSDEEFWIAYGKEKGIKLSPDFKNSFKQVMKEAISINPEMYQLVDQLKGQKPVAMLSNIDARLSKLVRSFGFYDPFYPCLLSCEIGCEKPDRKAYEILMNELGLPPAEIVFIDDMPENIEAASKLGLDAILFESPAQIRSELNKSLFDDLFYRSPRR